MDPEDLPLILQNQANVCPIEVAHLLYFEAAGICGMVVLVLLIVAWLAAAGTWRDCERSVMILRKMVMKRQTYRSYTLW